MGDTSHLIGQWFGRFQIQECLSRLLFRSGTAKYRAWDSQARFPVAVTVFPVEPDYVAALRPTLDAIGRDLARVVDSSAVRTFATGVEGEYAYLVTQLVQGVPLRKLAGLIQMPSTVASWGIQLARALHAAHSVGVVHRRVTPSSILLDESMDTVVLTDFGMADVEGAFFRVGQTSATGRLGGMPEYMSPELVRGECVDARSDVYASGCVVYELLTGRPPFIGKVPFKVAEQQVYEPLTPVRAINPKVPGELAMHIERALQKDPKRRFQSCAEMAEALTPFADEWRPHMNDLPPFPHLRSDRPLRQLRDLSDGSVPGASHVSGSFEGLWADITHGDEPAQPYRAYPADHDSYADSISACERTDPNAYPLDFGPNAPPAKGSDRTSVYVAHAHADVEFARLLVHDLREAGFAVWFDEDQILAGNIVAAMDDGLMGADYEVPLLSPAALGSAWLRSEIDAAIWRTRHHQMRGVIPVDVKPYDRNKLWPMVGMLKRYDLTQEYDHGLDALIRALRAPRGAYGPESI